jgi:hypothetical protein
MATDRRQPEDEFDPLDRLLAQARWEEPEAETMRKLRRQWNSLSNPEHRFTWPRLVAMAAAVAFAATALPMLRYMQRQPAAISRQPTITASTLTIEPLALSRPATNLEVAMLRLSEPTQKKTVRIMPQGVPLIPLVTGWGVNVPMTQPTQVATTIASPPADPASLIRTAAADPKDRDHALDELSALGPARAGNAMFNLFADPSTSQAATAAVCKNAPAWTDALFAALGDARTAVRQSAANALAQIDGPVVTARLTNMAQAGVHRREAVAALVQIHSPQARQFIAAAAEAPGLSAIVRSALVQYQEVHSQTGVVQ